MTATEMHVCKHSSPSGLTRSQNITQRVTNPDLFLWKKNTQQNSVGETCESKRKIITWVNKAYLWLLDNPCPKKFRTSIQKSFLCHAPAVKKL